MIGCLFVRDVRFFPAGAVADPPPQFARNIVQGKSYDLADPAVAGYFADVLQLTLGAAVELDFQSALAPVRAGVRRPAAGAVPARPAVLQGGRPGLLPPALRYQRHAHPAGAAGGPHPARSPGAGSTGSTTGCCSGPMSTPCSTAATSAWTRGTACWSARGCGRTSATATSSTPRPVRSSTCRNAGPTGRAGSSSSGTSTRSSSRQPQPDQTLTRSGSSS